MDFESFTHVRMNERIKKHGLLKLCILYLTCILDSFKYVANPSLSLALISIACPKSWDMGVQMS